MKDKCNINLSYKASWPGVLIYVLVVMAISGGCMWAVSFIPIEDLGDVIWAAFIVPVALTAGFCVAGLIVAASIFLFGWAVLKIEEM